MGTNYQPLIIWAQNQRAFRCARRLPVNNKHETAVRLISDDLEAPERPQNFEVDNSSPVEPDIWRAATAAAAAAAAGPHACAGNTFGLLKYSQRNELSRALQPADMSMRGSQGVVWAWILVAETQFHSASVMVNYSGLKKATAAAEGHGAPSFSSATSTDMWNM